MTQHQESLHQQEVIKWRNTFVQKYPELALLHSSLNGVHFPRKGKKISMQAIRAKREGMLAGVWDLFLPVKRNGGWAKIPHSGLYIEMKSKTGRLTPTQKTFQLLVEAQDFKCVICRSWIEARDELVAYLES